MKVTRKSNQEPVQAGILSDILKGFEKALKNYGMRLLEDEQLDDGSITYTLSCMVYNEDSQENEEVEFEVNGRPTDDTKEKVNLSFKYKSPDDGSEIKVTDKYKDVPNNQDEIVKYCTRFTEQVFGTDALKRMPEPVNQNKQIKATFNKITSSEAVEVSLSNINANFDIADAYGQVCDLCSEDTFVAALPEGDSSYCIEIVEDGYDCNECESTYDVELVDQLKNMYKICAIFQFDLDAIFALASGVGMDRVQSRAGDYRWELSHLRDTLNRAIVARTGNAISVKEVCEFLSSVDTVFPADKSTFTFMEFLEFVKPYALKLHTGLAAVSCNISEDDLFYHAIQNSKDFWQGEYEFRLKREMLI